MQNDNKATPNRHVIRKSKYNFLLHELESWKEASLVTQEQLLDIKAYYEVSNSYFSKMLINLGAVLMGAALLSYIAANWMEFSRVTKISLILLAYVGSVISAWITEKRSQILSRALLLLSSFAYGGGIFLVAQIFHEGGHYTNALLLWIAGITPVCMLFKDRPQLSLIQVLTIVYLFGIFFDVHYSFRHSNSELLTTLIFFKWQIALVAGLWALWLRTRGRINFNLNLLITIFITFLILNIWTINEAEIVLVLFGLGIVLGFFPFGKLDDMNTWGVVLVGVCGLIMTSHDFWRDGPVNLLNYFFYIYPSIGSRLSPDVLAVCSGVLTCVLMTLFMLRGSALAVFFFCGVILRYFFDKFYDFLPKSVMFAVGGVILVAVGLLIGKIRKNMNIKRNVENASKEVP